VETANRNSCACVYGWRAAAVAAVIVWFGWIFVQALATQSSTANAMRAAGRTEKNVVRACVFNVGVLRFSGERPLPAAAETVPA